MVVPWCGIGGSPERCRSVNDVYGRTQKEDWLAKKKNKNKNKKEGKTTAIDIMKRGILSLIPPTLD